MKKNHRDALNKLITDEMTIEESIETVEAYHAAHPDLYEAPAYDLYDYYSEYAGEEPYEPAYTGPVPDTIW